MSKAIYIHLTELESQESKQRATIIKRLKKIESDTEIILEKLKNNEAVTRVELSQKLPEKKIKLQKLEELLEGMGIDVDDVIQVLENYSETLKDETTNNSDISNKIETNNNDKVVKKEDIEEPAPNTNISNISPSENGAYIHFSAEEFNLTGRKPSHIMIYYETIEIKNLIEILIEIVKYALKIDKDKLIEMAAAKWKPDSFRKPILADKKAFIRQKKRAYTIIKNIIYLDTNLSGKQIWIISKIFLKEFHIQEDWVRVYIKN